MRAASSHSGAGRFIDERRFPLKRYSFSIGIVAVVMLVALRVTIGWHFFYEGVWKIAHADKFSATPFLTQAKGPAADLFYAMVYDIDGRQRLKIEENEKGQPVVRGEVYLRAWDDLWKRAVKKYRMSEEQAKQAEDIYLRYADSLESYLAANLEDIQAYFDSLDRFYQRKAGGNNGAAFQEERMWKRQQELRGEVGAWLSEIEGMEDEYRLALYRILDEDQKALGYLKESWSQESLMDFAVTWGLTAIGFCLMIGFCTRLAALGGGAFLISVLLTQPPWPSIYPPFHPSVGHALIVDKNFVEMVAIFALAALPVGRWGGIDFFLYYWLGKPLLDWFNQPAGSGNRTKEKGQ